MSEADRIEETLREVNKVAKIDSIRRKVQMIYDTTCYHGMTPCYRVDIITWQQINGLALEILNTINEK